MFADIIGHKEIIKCLKNAIRSGRIANAYIFSGPSGVGKKLTALNFAKALNCMNSPDDACDVCISCKKIDDRNHPDVISIEPEGQKIKIDQVRLLQRQSAYKPMEGRYKVYVISDAEKLTLEAANSLLKTLEEPPSNTVILLISTAYSSLLPTIRSRCISIKFNPIPHEVLKFALAEKFGISEAEAEVMATRSQGNVKVAMELLSSPVKSSDTKLMSLVRLLSQKDVESMIAVFREAEELSNDTEVLNELVGIYRDALLLKHGCPRHLLLNRDKVTLIEKLANRNTDSQIEAMLKRILKTLNLIEKNVNPILAIEVMFFQSMRPS